jgi:predicted SAM-dependent methyltransferase
MGEPRDNFGEAVNKEDFVVCPVCGKNVCHYYNVKPINFDGMVRFHHCGCGVLFRDKEGNFPYTDKPERNPKQTARFKYLVDTYFPLIEEITFGRKMLEVGYGFNPYIMRYARDRGWVCTGIEVDPKKSKEKGIELIKGDFTDPRKFDLILMCHVFEHFRQWQYALMKAHELLRPEGVLFITSPDASLLNEYGMKQFTWGDASHRILFSNQAFTREVERLMFQRILIRTNKSHRFPGYMDFHAVFQKVYYDEPYIGGYDWGIDMEKMMKEAHGMDDAYKNMEEN